ncbi:hypothetical protein CYY_010485 [Polysphondylium violaceum]|uniref:PiggyBac transposable element-derived protein domain-containing protein n=1 Tax=Polysphondylium violaceum TaxID=133409 RepID=A0A8J4UTT1_9MYCE|nr:hypothetical protein CYY_010485 [Polysphondylium violaceum]
MEYLNQNNFFFLISVASNRCAKVFNDLLTPQERKTNFAKGTIFVGSSDKCTAMAWQCKEKKIFYLLTNIPEPFLQQKTQELGRKSKTKKNNKFETIHINTPRAIWIYNSCHNYVDASKMIINRQRNIQRARTYSRVVLHDILYILLYNSFISANHFLPKETPSFRFRDYLLHLVNHQFSSQTPNRYSSNTLNIPHLIPSERFLCIMCRYFQHLVKDLYKKPYQTEKVCICHNQPLHDKCNMVFHNFRYQFNFHKHS